ncbi:MAG: vWA domain-containing protein [Anaerolineae bacterium]
MRQKPCNQKTPGERGQSLILVAFAIFALLGFAGLAVDLGLSYVTRVRVRRAADAAALAAATELPLEAAAQVRALEYLEANGYPCGLNVQIVNGNLLYTCNNPETRVEINSGYAGSYISGPDGEQAQRIIRINTAPYREDVYADNTASRIEVNIQDSAEVFFMQLFGFKDVKVNGRAVGENINNLDVVLVFDVSGSMEFDTLCYGCWTPVSGQTYPDGARWPLPWGGPADGPPTHCSGSGTYLTYNSRRYIIIEAEDYSRNNVSVNRDQYTMGMTYWTLQRNGGTDLSTTVLPAYLRDTSGSAGALGRDTRGAYIAHFPYRNHTQGDGAGSNCVWNDLLNGQKCLRDDWIYSVGGPYDAPRVDYDFQVPSSGTWYIWARGQGRDGGIGNLMWGINRTPIASVRNDANTSFEVRNQLLYNGATSAGWRWVQLGSQTFNAGTTYELNLWAGGVGFALDRIIITTDSRTPASAVSSDSNFTAQVLNNTANIDNNRTGSACDPCDERYGGYPGGPGGNKPPNCVIPGFPVDHPSNYRYLHDIYDDEQPIRGAKEAAARFIERFDPLYDQVGYVTYSSSAQIVSELECTRRCSIPTNKCTCSYDRILSTVTNKIRASNAGGSTNIPYGLMLGIDVLSSKSGHYGRPGAAHIMVFMTDGEANTIDGTNAVCYAQDYWPKNTGITNIDRAKDCTVYYARQARNNGIVIYSITLGDGADMEVMQYIAEMTGGVHRHAPRPEQLDPIFEELYNRIFLRLVE